MPLLFDIVPKALKGKVVKNLENDILITHDGHLNTGMHGTYFMLDYLTKSDRSDLIFTITNQKTYPGWGYMIENGATTIWEEWNGDNSQIHNTLISIGAWFIQGIGGIQVDEDAPGYKHFLIKPAFVGDLTFARTQFESMYGTIITDWRLKGGQILLNVTVPANTTATVYLPAIRSDDVKESGQPAALSPDIDFLRMENNKAVYKIQSGRYAFTCPL
jgi:alpha-L-rhamnosidase